MKPTAKLRWKEMDRHRTCMSPHEPPLWPYKLQQWWVEETLTATVGGIKENRDVGIWRDIEIKND